MKTLTIIGQIPNNMKKWGALKTNLRSQELRSFWDECKQFAEKAWRITIKYATADAKGALAFGIGGHLEVLQLVFVLAELEQVLVLSEVLLEVRLAEVLVLPYMKRYKNIAHYPLLL